MRNPLAPHRSLSTQDSWPEFIAKHAEEMHRVISGFDRLVFSGSLRAIRYAVEIKAYLIRKRVWLGDFAQHLEAVSEWLKQSSLADAQKLGRTIRYQASSQIDKDAVAGEIAAHEKITSGPVCVLTCPAEASRCTAIGRQEARLVVAAAQMPLPLSLLDASRVRFHEGSHSNLVSLPRANLSERPEMAGVPA